MPTSPAPDAGPAMCPGIAVLGGGGGAGGSDGDGDGRGSGGDEGGGRRSDGAAGDGKNVPDPTAYPDCGTASHPVDVVTGRAFTLPVTDLRLGGPLPLVFQRVYSSAMASRDVGLGYGWAHTLGWEIELKGRGIVVWNEQGVDIEFPRIQEGEEVIGPWAWLLRRTSDGFLLDTGDGRTRVFSLLEPQRRAYRLTSIEDRNANRIRIDYKSGHYHQVEDSAGRVVHLCTEPSGRISSIEVDSAHPGGERETIAFYTYNENGELASVIDAEGYPSQYEYDARHRLVSETDRIGLCFRFVYDSKGRCIESWGAHRDRPDQSLVDARPTMLHDGTTKAKGIHHCKFEYHAGWYSEVADSTQVRRFFGNRHGTLEKSVVGGGVVSATYRDDGLQMARMDEVGAVTTFERDMRGRITKVTAPLDRVTVIERDASGLPTRITDPAGGVTTLERDSRGNVLFATDAAGATTMYVYDARGLVVEEISPTGGLRMFAYDERGDLIVLTEPSGGAWCFSYDAWGRRTSVTDPAGNETRYEYSKRGEVRAIRHADGGATKYAYDGEGHLLLIEEPSGATTQFEWGGYHKLCSRTDANGGVARLRYNAEGELLEIYNELGEVHRLEYDPSGRLVGETTFDGRRLRYRNDLAGRLERAQNGSRELTDYTYDLAGQLVQRELHDGSTEEYAYNARGELVGVKWPAGELRIERDAMGRALREAQVVGEVEHWVTSRYDKAGDRVERTTSLGHKEAILRGPLGERTRTVFEDTDVIQHVADPLGREVARELSRGGWMYHQYDALSRVSRRRAGGADSPWQACTEGLGGQSAAPGAGRIDVSYGYDLNGELISLTDRAWGATTIHYDPLGQLLALVPERARAELFRYDSAGNLYEDGPGAEPRAYGPGNRLHWKGNTEHVWDADGRLREKRVYDPSAGAVDVWRYAWNAAGLLRSVTQPDGTEVDFTYDPFARRLQKRVTVTGRFRADRVEVSTTNFVWDGDVLVHEVTQRSGPDGTSDVEERTYCFADDSFEPTAHCETRIGENGEKIGEWFHYVNDPIGTPERVLNAAGEIICELRRSAWGITEELPGSTACTPLRFQGQYEDREIGLCYARFRYYDPALGRFVSSDPVGLGDGLHGFRYVINPFRWVDPLGTTKADRSWTRTNTAVGRLPRFSGRNTDYVRRSCLDAGFKPDKDKPENMVHSDGSEVRINEPHKKDRGPTRGGFRGDVEIHYHKEWKDPYGNPKYELDDYGRINSDPNRTHIIGWKKECT